MTIYYKNIANTFYDITYIKVTYLHEDMLQSYI